MRARVVEVAKEGELFCARIRLEKEGKEHEIRVAKLLRKPHRARASIEGDHIVIYLEDSEGKPLSTCCLHVKHLERGCLDCKSLMIPP